MNFIEELRNLDPKDVGRWPFLYRALAISLLFVVLTAALIYFIPIRTQMPDLDRARADEVSLMSTFDDKQRKAANIEAYKAQLKEMERSFGAMLRQLPGRTEVPSLLVDISQTGLAAGLQEKLFQPAPEVKKDFYAELPIKIRLTGSYHEFGTFVSGIAALPRIVTLHDITIVPEGRESGPDRLTLDVTAKTYRYLEDTETTPADKGKPGAAAPAAAGGSG
ncbi:MAG TPA: type 4a pilus biogenesis protein PilO [Candidatus Acidoferrales bacterium]|nr:type 4a pilus biogenesis protein PilO [Candidatus Acidoferrales bacterium]